MSDRIWLGPAGPRPGYAQAHTPASVSAWTLIYVGSGRMCTGEITRFWLQSIATRLQSTAIVGWNRSSASTTKSAAAATSSGPSPATPRVEPPTAHRRARPLHHYERLDSSLSPLTRRDPEQTRQPSRRGSAFGGGARQRAREHARRARRGQAGELIRYAGPAGKDATSKLQPQGLARQPQAGATMWWR